MSKITLFRTSQYVNDMREYDIYLDGQEINTISNGEIKTIEVSEGSHEIYLKIDWCKSKKININLTEGQEMKLKCGSKITGIRKFFALFYIFSTNIFVYLDYLSDSEVIYSDNKKIKTWNEIKSMGLRSFILKYGILRFGIPIAILNGLLILIFNHKNYSIQEYILKMGISLVAFSLVGGTIFGALMWAILKNNAK